VLLAVYGMFFLALLALLRIAQRRTATAAPAPESDAGRRAPEAVARGGYS
jgi:hypothetical protein